MILSNIQMIVKCIHVVPGYTGSLFLYHSVINIQAYCASTNNLTLSTGLIYKFQTNSPFSYRLKTTYVDCFFWKCSHPFVSSLAQRLSLQLYVEVFINPCWSFSLASGKVSAIIEPLPSFCPQDTIKCLAPLPLFKTQIQMVLSVPRPAVVVRIALAHWQELSLRRGESCIILPSMP